MSTLGFIPPVPAAPLIGPGLQAAFAAVAALFAGGATYETIKNKNFLTENYGPETSISLPDDFAFEPWGPDPYEQEPSVTYPPMPLFPNQALLDPPPGPIREDLNQRRPFPPQLEPQTEPRPNMVPVPVPFPPIGAGEGDLGGWGAANKIFINNPEWKAWRPRYKSDYGSFEPVNWDRVNFTVSVERIDGIIWFRPYVEFIEGQTIRRRWNPPLKTRVVPQPTDFGVTGRYSDVPGVEFEFEVETLSFYVVPLRTTMTEQLKTLVSDNQTALQAQALQKEEEERKRNAPLIYTPNEVIPTEVEVETDVDTEKPKAPVFPAPATPFPPLPDIQWPPGVLTPVNPNNPVPIPPIDQRGFPIQPVPLRPTPSDVHFPWPGAEPAPSGGVPATLAGIAAEVGRIENKTSQIGKSMGGLNAGDLALLAALLADLLAALQPEQGFPSDTYTLTGVCEELNDSGEQPVFSTPVGGATFPEATLSRLDAMQYLLQAHLGYKTPTCGSTKPKLEGDWVTVRFESDANSPNGERPLRKLLRYRTKSGSDLGTTTAYWSDFIWQAGPVCVRHDGAWWGSPQVWARDANEGKRVLRHAAREAGIDPDQNGQWSVSGSRNPRYGMPGTMRVAQVSGLDWVTKREGPSALPDLAADP